MMTTPVFTLQQTSDAIRRGARVATSGDSPPPQETAHKSAAYRDNQSHYQSLAQKCLGEGDYRQAAEKSWGAYARAIKVTSADYGLLVTTHSDVLGVAQQLTALTVGADAAAATRLSNGFHLARSLHQHFYENDLEDEEVVRVVEEVLAVIDLLQTLFHV